MHHKLQSSNRKNDGQNSVGRNPKQSSTTEIASNDAGAECAPGTADFKLEIASTENPQPLRCEVARSVGYDPTGERAVPCGAAAQVICEHCGPMCSPCAEETFCFDGEHKLAALPEDGPLPAKRKRRGPIVEVVYVEIKCPNCGRVRLALPKKHRPQRVRKCPICKTKSPAEYLAHGFTRRRLPYHEVFTGQKQLPEGVEFKKRTPWDRRPNWWVKE